MIYAVFRFWLYFKACLVVFVKKEKKKKLVPVVYMAYPYEASTHLQTFFFSILTSRRAYMHDKFQYSLATSNEPSKSDSNQLFHRIEYIIQDLSTVRRKDDTYRILIYTSHA